MIKEIDHIGIAVRDLKEAVRRYTDTLGLECEGTEKIDDQKIIVATIMVGGIKVELLQSTRSDGPIGRFIEKRGEGMHHIAFRVDNIDKMLYALKKQGVHLIDETPRNGAGGSRIAFVHPKEMGGVLVELVERTEEGRHHFPSPTK